MKQKIFFCFYFFGWKKKIWTPSIVQVFGLIKNIIDPEFSFWLFSLKVLSIENIFLNIFCYSQSFRISIFFSPTSVGCSLTSTIGLSIQNVYFNKFFNNWLKRSTPCGWMNGFSLDIPNFFHLNRDEIVKQLNDKERVSAALENFEIRKVILNCFGIFQK